MLVAFGGWGFLAVLVVCVTAIVLLVGWQEGRKP